ncbi:MAG TPA: ATP-binding protein, partial [Coleofasciculaceae cyanobacterium]
STYQFLLTILDKAQGITILAGRQAWAPTSNGAMIPVPFPMPNFVQRRTCWQVNLAQANLKLSEPDLDAVSDRFRLTPDQIANALTTAHNQARWRVAQALLEKPIESTQISLNDLFTAARAQSGHDLTGLARKIQPRHHWNEIILPSEQLTLLRELCNQVKYHQIVCGEWGFDRKLSLGKGISVLFSGSPGTGKTMAAEVIANELQLDLYKIDLSQIVSKYIGETEKNLDRIFTIAENANAILLFDEADALFGKRSEVKDAHDRYANIEIAYLLQKMEEYEGITILTTNLRQNLDEAFIRRVRFIIEFPIPDADYRLQIWRGIWPKETPLAADVDLQRIAQQFQLVGGNIRNIALAAAFLAAGNGEKIGMKHLLQATKREFQKMGRLVNEEEFLKLESRV